MQPLSPAGQQVIDDVARRHGYSTDAVLSMLQSVIHGNGRMAQFNHPEFAGPGQWMSGGMTMVSDMFNDNLKASISRLCAELAQRVAAQPDLLASGSFQSQRQGGQHQVSGATGAHSATPHAARAGGASLLIAPAQGGAGNWWGADMPAPASTGAQNGVRYAYFPQERRLAIDVNGRVTLYDTLDHRIGGFSQQQSRGGSLGFTSQHGLIDVARLPVVSVDGVARTAPSKPAAAAPAPAPSSTAPQHAATSGAGGAAGMDIFAAIDKLAELRSRNILTEAEFSAKKAELLARL